MNYDEIEQLRARHPAWALLSSRNVALVLSFLGRVFVDANESNIAASRLIRELDDEIYALNRRLVVIDEAFGRGSDDSTRYALSLFTNLGLQLLIVTPLQKIHVIEPHVSCVGFVDNLEGNYSRLQRLTIEEHRRRRVDASAPEG